MQQTRYSMKNLSIVFSITMVLGMFTLVVGSYLLTYMAYHERAYVTLSIGAACFIGSLAGLIVKPSRVKMALCYSVIAVGMLAFLIGSNYLTYPWSHIYRERAYIVLGIGTLCLLGGIGGAFALQPKAKKVTCYSILALGIVASLGIIGLIVGVDQLILLESPKYAPVLLGSGSACLLGGIVSTIMLQRRMHHSVLV